MRLKLKDILPNPNRDLLSCPLKPEKLAELSRSINETGFWENVVVRKNTKGEYELAYGHNRLQAAINAGIEEADFIVKELSDEMMIKIMDNENREAYGTDLLSVMESVQAVVKALAAGRIKPFEHKESGVKQSLLRYAPSYIPGKIPPVSNLAKGTAYTVKDVASFLGRMRSDKDAERVVNAAFDVLELEEQKVPGWGRKQLLSKYKSLRTIPVDPILQDARAAREACARRAALEKSNAVEAKAKGDEVQANLDRLMAERVAAEKEEKRIETEYAAAAREKNAARVKQLREEMKERAKADEAREALIKQTNKEAKATEKAIAKTEEKAVEKIKQLEVKAAQRWINQHEALIGRVNRTFSEEEGLYAELTKWRMNERCTEAQRSAMQLALRDLSARAENFNPFTGPPRRSTKPTKRRKQ